MKNTIPKTKLEIELFCDKIILLNANRKLQTHIEVLQEVLKISYIKK